MRTVVLGAGPAGCAAALALARRGHDVVLVDREELAAAADADADRVFDTWDRSGVGQFRQPHNFLGLGRAILRDDLPDVYDALLARGAGEIRQNVFLGPAAGAPGDEDLAIIACRRPVIDAVLHAAVAAQTGVTYRAGAVRGLHLAGTHVTGVEFPSGETLGADLVIDALGRNSAVRQWLAAHDAPVWPEHASESKLLYYSRHYRFRDEPLPAASVLGGPRGDIGYLAFACFIGDNRTFSVAVMTPAWEKEWRELRDPAAYDRVLRQLPGLGPWVAAAEPITPVLPMGQLRNTLRDTVPNGRPAVTGVVPIGDARCHTNPTFAFGLSLSLGHAKAVAAAADTAADDADLVAMVERAVGGDAAARFAAVSAEDRDRARLWSGEPISPTSRTDTLPLFLRTVMTRAGMRDPEILRAVCRRINLLDPVDALAADTELLDRAEKIFREMPPGDSPPPRAALLAALRGVDQ